MEMNREELEKFLANNLITKQQARQITGQSHSAFQQSVNTGQLKPIYQQGQGTGMVRLYLKKEVEEYALSVKERRSRLQK